jgi:hypothetical protein
VHLKWKSELILKSYLCSIAIALQEDHAVILNPDCSTSFTNLQNALDRLLPYHVFQYPGLGDIPDIGNCIQNDPLLIQQGNFVTQRCEELLVRAQKLV